MIIPPNGSPGKTFLDAGCGNGTVCAAAAVLGCKVTGVDISDSVERAAKRFPAVEFIRADLSEPLPLGLFDLVHCGGVLHHTPDTRHAFETLAEHVAPDGHYFVWLYSDVPGRIYASKEAIRSLSLPYAAKSAVATAFAMQARLRSRQLTFREQRTIQHDFFTPTYRWEHTPSEVINWYATLGMPARQTREGRDGFGVLGERV